jgi:nickel-dependent lactate racemase
VSFLVTYVQTRRETAFKEAITELVEAGRSANELLAREYKISVRDAIIRLQAVGGFFLDMIVFFSSQIPDEYLTEDT